MAVLPAKNVGGKQPSTGARFRQRKISVKVALPIFKQRDITTSDADLEPSQVHHLNQSATQQQRDLHTIETGVDKNEEDEVHLQQVINAAQKALLGSKQQDSEKKKADPSVYIPTPDASRIWPDAHKYYNDPTFREPDSYIKFSATVEDTVGCEYNMDEADEEFFEKSLKVNYPKPRKIKQEKSKANQPNNKSSDPTVDTRPCSDAEFEVICDKFEKKIEEKQPFLSMDPSNILSYEELSGYILEEVNSTTTNTPFVQLGSSYRYMSTSTVKEKLSKELNYEPFVTLFDKNPLDQNVTSATRPIPKLLELFGKPIYDHWAKRKIERRGKHIHASLKFEDPNASEKDNDNDPYICFRRREFRQARKTRRADTLGAERIRLLQKSLHRARNLIFSVCQRELLKLETWESEHQIFRLRSEAKNSKRAVGVKGDDYLFYPHKRRKIAKLKEQEEEKEAAAIAAATKVRGHKRSKTELGRDAADAAAANRDKLVPAQQLSQQQQQQQTQLLQQQQQQQQQEQEQASASTQPYVKLPPSKIPDMDLVTVSLVLKEKNETIKRAVLEKLRKRKEQDKGYINVTDDPFQPFFDISTNSNDKNKELSHIPYSSIAASSYHQINTTNYIGETLKKLLENGKNPLPGIKTFRGSNGELIPSKAFPHLSTLLQNHVNNNRINSASYVAQLLSNIESNNFSAYSNGYGRQYEQLKQRHEQEQQIQQQLNPSHQVQHQPPFGEQDEDTNLSEPVFRLRKRLGRANRTFIDRRGLVERPHDVIDEFLNFDDDESSNEDDHPMIIDSDQSKLSNISNVYDSKADTIKRLDSRWQFDNDLTEHQRGLKSPFSLDPSKLNSISDDTQSIRFGSMLLSKSYDLLRESAHQRQILMQQARMRAAQQQQQQISTRNAQVAAVQQQQQLQQQQQQQQSQPSSQPHPPQPQQRSQNQQIARNQTPIPTSSSPSDSIHAITSNSNAAASTKRKNAIKKETQGNSTPLNNGTGHDAKSNAAQSRKASVANSANSSSPFLASQIQEQEQQRRQQSLSEAQSQSSQARLKKNQMSPKKAAQSPTKQMPNLTNNSNITNNPSLQISENSNTK